MLCVASLGLMVANAAQIPVSKVSNRPRWTWGGNHLYKVGISTKASL